MGEAVRRFGAGDGDGSLAGCWLRRQNRGMSAAALLGREAELGELRAFLAEVTEGPVGLVLSGEAGIGKTSLWRAGVEEAGACFGRVLTCRGVETEASLSYAGLSDLLGEALDEAAPSLAAPRLRALEVALLLAEPSDGALDAHAVGLAVRDVLEVLSRDGPVLVAMDDVQSLDRASAGVLQVAFRRLRREPIGVLATVRATHDESLSFGLRDSLAEQRLTELKLGPLSVGALRHLLDERLGLRLTRSELGRLQQASGGNPFFALELGRELVRLEDRPSAGQRLRIPAGLKEAVGARLAKLPEDASDVLLAVAALARPTVELVAAAHGDTERVRTAISAAVTSEIVELDDSRIRFTHPLLGAICYERAPVWKRREVHRALASAVPDIEERARHLALAAEGPDAAVAGELDRAAEHAATRDATAAAAELCELAAGLTPEDPPAYRRRVLRAAHYQRLAGELDGAAALLHRLLPQVPAGLERADVLLELLRTLSGDRRMRRDLFDQALVAAAEDDVRSARILNSRAGLQLWDGDVSAGLADARAALESSERAGDPGLLAMAIARVGTLEAYACDVTPGLLERGAEIETRHGLKLEYWACPRFELARLLMRRGDIGSSRAMLEHLVASAAARGDESTRAMVQWVLCMLEWVAGRLPRALEHAAAAYELGEELENPHGRLWVGRMKALVEADLGLVREARESAEEGLAHSEGTSNAFGAIAATGALGRIELMHANVAGAAGYLRGLPGRLLAAGMNDPTWAVWPDAIEAIIGAGELELARAGLDGWERNSKRLASPLALAGVRRCRGLLAAADGDLDAGLTMLELAVSQRSAGAYPLELGRTLLSLGMLRRRALQKKAAREALEQAARQFEELGAPVWAERARAELRRISGRRAGGDELTETELRVAALAADGLSNRQIASALFMGLSTVEAHLSRAYRKLGIGSRAALASRLAPPADDGVRPGDDPSQT